MHLFTSNRYELRGRVYSKPPLEQHLDLQEKNVAQEGVLPYTELCEVNEVSILEVQ